MTRKAEIDTITMRPLTKILTLPMRQDRNCAEPTSIMMNGVAENMKAPSMDFRHALKSVSDLHEAGVTISAKADATFMVGSPNAVLLGESPHQGFEPLMDAGMSTVEILRAATLLAAQRLCEDRGAIQVGRNEQKYSFSKKTRSKTFVSRDLLSKLGVVDQRSPCSHRKTKTGAFIGGMSSILYHKLERD